MEDTLNMSPPTMDESTSKAVSMSTEIMIVSIVVLCFVIGFCFFLNMYARWFWVYNNEDPTILSWRRRVARQMPQSAADSRRRRRRGLDPAAIRSLPAVVYNPKDFKEGLECSVCLSEVSEGEKARLLPKCNHGFHLECIDMWFQSHSTCPLCRNSVISDDDDDNHVEVQNDGGGDYFSDSSESDDEHNHDDDDDGSYGSPRVTELPVFPTNVLYWGNETQVRSLGQADHDDGDDDDGDHASSSLGVGRARNGECDEVVIEMPPPPPEEPKTPMMTRLKSLKRLLSLGKRVAVAPYPNHGSTSCDVNQSQQV